MEKAQLFFLSDEYYREFPDKGLMENKYDENGSVRSRPCFFAFSDAKHPEIRWIVPISSQVAKYERIAKKKELHRGYCDTIRFGTVLGRKAAFLIQNMCPATDRYLTPYIGKDHNPVPLARKTADDVRRNAIAVLAQERQVVANGKPRIGIIFPDVFKIYEALEKQL